MRAVRLAAKVGWGRERGSWAPRAVVVAAREMRRAVMMILRRGDEVGERSIFFECTENKDVW